MDKSRPNHSIFSEIRLIIRPEAGLPILLCLLVLTLIPLVVADIHARLRYAKHLDDEISNTLHMVSTLASHDLNLFFQTRLADTDQLAGDAHTRAFFNTLTKRYRDAGLPLAAFVESTIWATTVSAFDAAIHLHAELHGYDDILLITSSGDIVYSSSRSDDLGAHLNPLAENASGLAAVVQAALSNGKPLCSRFSSHPAAGESMVTFVAAPIDLETLPRAGVVVCRIPAGDIGQRLETAEQFAEGLHLRFIDASMNVIAGSAMPRGAPPLKVPPALTEQWRQRSLQNEASPSSTRPVTYQHAGKGLWMGICEDLPVNGYHYGLIVETDLDIAKASLVRLKRFNLIVFVLTTMLALGAAIFLARRYVLPPHRLVERLEGLPGSLRRRLSLPSDRSEIDRLSAAFDTLIEQMGKLKADNENRILLLTGLTCLHRRISGEQSIDALCHSTIDYLSEFLGLKRAEFYIFKEGNQLERVSRLPAHPGRHPKKTVPFGEGHVGQAALEQNIAAFRSDAISTLLTAVPQATLGNLIAVPLVLRHALLGVMELEKPMVFSPSEMRFVEAAAEVIKVALKTTLIHQQEEILRQNNRDQARQLKIREAALETSAQELKSQKQAFQETEQHLQFKQLELEAANAQMAKNASTLEANLAILEQQKREMQEQNAALERAHRNLAEKARQLEISSQYKTEFMANMSHELRTPLNSILLLSQLLMENKDNSLTDRQFEFARTIQAAGEDLLNLINEILDLAKVESGKMEIEHRMVAIEDIVNAMQETFAPLAAQKGLEFTTNVETAVPAHVSTDRKRLEQIVKNFLSNAFKFTEAGHIRLTISVVSPPEARGTSDDNASEPMLAIAVSDTGIGIPANKHEMIFEAFQQVDGSTRRNYGGTGLGLSISRELARMLCGKIIVDSQEGEGSRFTLFIPMVDACDQTAATDSLVTISNETATVAEMSAMPDETPDADAQEAREMDHTDPFKISPTTPCILVIDHETETAKAIADVIRPDGLQLLLAHKHQTGLHYVDYYHPQAIFIRLVHPETKTWHLVRYIRANLNNRDLPIFSFSDGNHNALAVVHGATGHLQMPVGGDEIEQALGRVVEPREAETDRSVMVVTPSASTATRIRSVVGSVDFDVVHLDNGEQAAHRLEHADVQAIIVDLTNKFEKPHALAAALQNHPVPLMFYPTGKLPEPLAEAFGQAGITIEVGCLESEAQLLRALTGTLRLTSEHLDQTRFAHVDHPNLRTSPRKSVLKDKKVLLADDDMRTVFAVSSVLEEQGIEVVTSKSGKESLDKLDGFPEIDLIILDVTITGVDDERVIEKIRQRERYRTTPVIALTTRAMAGDRARCIAAGADDYLSKPVKAERLTSMLTFWLDPLLISDLNP